MLLSGQMRSAKAIGLKIDLISLFSQFINIPNIYVKDDKWNVSWPNNV